MKVGDIVIVDKSDSSWKKPRMLNGMIGIIVEVFHDGIAVDFCLEKFDFMHSCGSLDNNTGYYLNEDNVKVIA